MTTNNAETTNDFDAIVAEYARQLSELSLVDLKVAYRGVFGSYPTKQFSTQEAMLDKMVTKFRNDNAPESTKETTEKKVKQPAKSIDQLLADLAATDDKAKKKTIRAALRRQGYKISEQTPKSAPAAENDGDDTESDD